MTDGQHHGELMKLRGMARNMWQRVEDMELHPAAMATLWGWYGNLLHALDQWDMDEADRLRILIMEKAIDEYAWETEKLINARGYTRDAAGNLRRLGTGELVGAPQ